jgi:plastocyanin
MRTTVVRFAALVAALGAAAQGVAATLEISVVDAQGKPVQNVAVYASAHGGSATAAPARQGAAQPTAIMDQQGHQFVPHVLVVQTGTEVTFPNSDTVSHHVYSFSATKPFELPLYKGDAYPPVTFDKAGIVVVGCNIHDSMLGYIRVVDTPHFAVTNERGVALIDGVPSGDVVVEAWTPRVRPAELPAAQHVTVGNGTAAAKFQITGRLAPAHEHGASSLTWDRY